MAGERRLCGELRGIAIHVVAHGDEVGERDRALRLECFSLERAVLYDVRQQLDGTGRVASWHRDRPAEALRTGCCTNATTEHLAFLGDLQRTARARAFECG